MLSRVYVDEREVEVGIRARRPQLLVRLGERDYAVDDFVIAGAEFSLRVDGQPLSGWWYRRGEELQIRLAGRTYSVQFTSHAKSAAATARADEVRASMPGVVVAVHRAVGDVVAAGDALLTLESMKLQATLVASHAARVAVLHVAAQSVFERGALLVSLAAAEDA
ncbi:MAG TPA: biotin/lipoyl-containing protein [Steroidobacteraceae bacterium]|jgi:acetyl/propionyl-CoA carboxylase alpha subunit|nr:biotin/lipoyl-containing protein [Steroidobacteraceae bacterium]